MTAAHLATKDGAPQSFTRSMYLCYSTNRGGTEQPPPTDHEDSAFLPPRPFLLQPDAPAMPRRGARQVLSNVLATLWLGLSAR